MKRCLIIFSFFIFIPVTFAENAITLPQGKFRARVKPIYASKINSQYNRDKTEESLVATFERELDVATAAKLNPKLAGAMNAFGVQNLGTFTPSLALSTLVVAGALEYGMTDDLTLGIIVPVITANTKFNLDFLKTEVAKTHPAFAPMDFVDAAEKTAIQKGYHAFEDWNKTALGDMELGLKYRWLNTQTVVVAMKTGVRLPTGRVDDPNHLTDIGFGDGQTDVGGTLLIDYKGLPNLLVNAMTKYTWQLPDKQRLRIPDEGELFTANVENLKRDIGDRFDAALYAEYTFLKNFNINATSSYFIKNRDSYQSALGFDTEKLALNTSQMSVMAAIGGGFSTLPWVKEGAFALPMDVDITVEVPLLGQNVAKASTVNLEYKLYF